MSMSRYQQRPAMSLFTLVLIVSALTSNCNVHASHRSRKLQSDYSDTARLRQLLRQLQNDDDQSQLSFESRAATAQGDCTGDIYNGYQWSGTVVMSAGGVDTAQRCMDSCDISKDCMGWSHKLESRMCWGMNKIEGIIAVAGVRSGSCVGRNLKTTCTESKVGYYGGNYKASPKTSQTSNDCMKQCSKEPTCFGWYFDTSRNQCWFTSFVRTYTASYDWLVTGACLAKQQRQRVADPLKSFRQEALDRHNQKRALHCVANLKADDTLDKDAQALADKLAAADVTPPNYDASTMFSVFFNKGNEAARGSAVVDSFYDEGLYYNYNKPDFSMTNHFPKIIWKSSTKLGVGRSFTTDKKTMFIVLKYDWQGDISKAYKTNVPRKCK